MADRRAHWDGTYTAKGETEVSWYQPVPERSLDWIKAAAPDHAAAIIDVGGGASRLTDHLLAADYADLTVLDISEVALSRTKARLGADADKVSWIVSDVTEWTAQRRWNVWHDRAVFHFLTDSALQDAYVRALVAGTAPGATVIMAAFAPNGPERCSGLPVQRYSPAELAARLGGEFVLTGEAAERHHTPFGTTQEFAYALFRRR
jgi:hypothetical protein